MACVPRGLRWVSCHRIPFLRPTEAYMLGVTPLTPGTCSLRQLGEQLFAVECAIHWSKRCLTVCQLLQAPCSGRACHELPPCFLAKKAQSGTSAWEPQARAPPLSSRELAGLCRVWNFAAVRTCGPGELACRCG